MRKLTQEEIGRASDPRVERYRPPENCQSLPPGATMQRLVHLDGEYVFVDRASHDKVCARFGLDPERMLKP